MRASLFLSLLLLGCSSPANAPGPVGPGSWRAGVSLPIDRFEAYAATAHGKVYFLGGITGVFGDARTVKESTRVDVFDPQTGAWTDGVPLPADGPHHHLAVAVIDDVIYVLGGFVGVVGGDPPGHFSPIATSYAFDGATWRRLKDMPAPRGAASAQAIGGKIYVVGGGDDEYVARADVTVYDPKADTWTSGAAMPTAREHVATCALGGKLVPAGGWFGAAKTTVAKAEMYDPAQDTWSALPDMPTVRGGVGGLGIGDVCFFVGGENWQLPPPGTTSAVEGFRLSTGKWETFAPMPTSRHGLGLALLGGVAYAVGGGPIQGNSYTSVVEVFTP